MTSFKEFLEEELRDPEFAQEYEEARSEMGFALALARRREQLELTQQALAAMTGIKQPMIARIEHGQMPTAPTLQRLAKALKVSIAFTGDEILIIPLSGRVKRNTRKEDSAEEYVKLAETDHAYKHELGGRSNAYKVKADEQVSIG